MKRKIALFLVVALLLSSLVMATDQKETVSDELYEKYQELIDEANAAYGYDLTLLPKSDITPYTEEEFAEILLEYCQNKESKITSCVQNTKVESRGGVIVPCSIQKTYQSITVTIQFEGVFDVRQDMYGTYYINYYYCLDPVATSSNPLLYYVADGALIEGCIDGGRTRTASQEYDVYYSNSIADHVTVTAYFYFNKNTGTITSNYF